MEKREIGNTGVKVTPLTFGTSVASNMPETYGYEVGEERALETIRAVIDGPANGIDTSNNYGFGRSEELIGKVIRERGGLPDGFVVSTKIDRDMESERLDAARVRKSFEESMARLGLDRVEILHLHDPEYASDLKDVTGKGGALEEMFKMKEEGLADAVGLAMGRIDIPLPLVRDWPFDIVLNHNRHTLLNRSAGELFDHAHQKGMAVFNAAPYAGGVLAKGSADMPRITYQAASDEELEPVRRIEEICASHGVDMGAAALQFSINDPRITTTVVGVSKPERVAESTGWARAELPSEVMAEISRVPASMEDPEASREYRPG